MSRPTISKAIKEFLPKKCYNCGSTQHLVYHHIVPVILGGNDTLLNIAVLCPSCHSKVHYGEKEVICHGGLVSDGIKAAQARGVHVGKPCADYANVIRLICKHSTQFNDICDEDFDMKTESEIMEMAGVKPVCYSKCKRMLVDAMNATEWPYEWEKPTVHKNRPMYKHCIEDIRSGKRKLTKIKTVNHEAEKVIEPEQSMQEVLADLRSISLISQYNIDSALAKWTKCR